MDHDQLKKTLRTFFAARRDRDHYCDYWQRRQTYNYMFDALRTNYANKCEYAMTYLKDMHYEQIMQ